MVRVVDVDIGSRPGVGGSHLFVTSTFIGCTEGHCLGFLLEKSGFNVFLFLALKILSRSWVFIKTSFGEWGAELILPEISTVSRTHEWVSISILRLAN
jgi:hypothetical protein